MRRALLGQRLDGGEGDLGAAAEDQDGLDGAEGVSHGVGLLVKVGQADQCRTGLGRDRGRRYPGRTMSTRKLIFAALLCGMAILVAFTVQVIMLSGSS